MPIGVHSRMESRSRASAEKDKGGEAGLDADRVTSGNKSGKKVNISPGAGDRFELDCSTPCMAEAPSAALASSFAEKDAVYMRKRQLGVQSPTRPACSHAQFSEEQEVTPKDHISMEGFTEQALPDTFCCYICPLSG